MNHEHHLIRILGVEKCSVCGAQVVDLSADWKRCDHCGGVHHRDRYRNGECVRAIGKPT